MAKKVFFEDARKNILEMFSIEFPNLDINQIDTFAGLFYQLLNYEEEGKKIRPNILITSNIGAIVKSISKTKKIVIYQDEDMSNFKAHIKALMCFCLRGWYIYINFGEDVIEYGIVTRLTSIKEKSLIQVLSEKSMMETLSKKTNIIIIKILGGGVISLSGGKGSSASLCFNLDSQSEYNWEDEISDFVDACVSKLKTTKRKIEDIKQMLKNIFSKALTNLHGTLCMVIDKDYKDKSGFLSDGTWLKEPIEFAKMFIKGNSFDESVLRSYADVLTTMLDFDGITVIDNAGRIRAYNIFIESSASASRKVIGGARRRAAYTILENKSKKIIGIYFQSQDGDNFYKEKGDLKKKKKIKIVGGEVVNENNDMLPLEIIAKLEQNKKKEEEKLEKEIANLEEKVEKLTKVVANSEKSEKEQKSEKSEKIDKENKVDKEIKPDSVDKTDKKELSDSKVKTEEDTTELHHLDEDNEEIDV